MLKAADFLRSSCCRGVIGRYGIDVCEVRDDRLEEVVPLLAYGFEDVEDEKSMLEERRGRAREGVRGEEGMTGIVGRPSFLLLRLLMKSRAATAYHGASKCVSRLKIHS